MSFDAILTYGNSSNGRDKLLRMTQYLTKLIRWHLKQQDIATDFQSKLHIIEKEISTGRKLFRLGRTLDSWRAAQKSIHLLDPVLRLTITASNINKAFFLLVDHYLWFAKVGLVKTDNKKWNLISSRFYLSALIFSTLRDLYAVHIELDKLKKDDDFKNQGFSTFLFSLFKVFTTNPAISVDLIKNLSDLSIPTNNLGYFSPSDGTLGTLGTLSSMLAALQIANPKYKLKP